MPLVQITPPAIEPVTVADAKLHMRVIDDNEDTLIALLIGAARRYAETYCQRSFITQTFTLFLDNWPCSFDGNPYFSGPFSMPSNAIQLERGPVISLDSIKYLDSGVLNTLSTSVYVADLTGPVPRITPKFGQIWPPISTPQIGNVQVNYTAGYGPAATDVPEGIRAWILLRVATLYENRESVAIVAKGRVEALPFVDTLLDPYIVATA